MENSENKPVGVLRVNCYIWFICLADSGVHPLHLAEIRCLTTFLHPSWRLT